ncbi:50S ribosomal protein L5 [archaeon CG10_big_fil_rev_8_21_14_0_10_43_11]|nr:MAG: 50S ribosomal protein L5 [archaeon CG10_big_fil_rev_8_21_14_0_10_43_11]
MKDVLVEKVTLNIGVGEAGDRVNHAVTILDRIANQKAVKTYGKKRIPTWNVRPGLPIGAKVTVRGAKAVALLKRLFEANDKKLRERQFDREGNVAFGIRSYIDIPDVRYDPEVGIFGLDVCVTLKRRGYRIKERKIANANVGTAHKIKKEEAIDFVKTAFEVNIV